MQTIGSITISGGIPTVGYNLVPLIILSMIKDAFEDYKRHKSDNEENNKLATSFNQTANKFTKKEWKEIYPGEIVKVESD